MSQQVSEDRGRAPQEKGNGLLTWLGGIGIVVAVCVLGGIATLLVRSAHEAREVAKAGEHLPATGTYDLVTEPAGDRTATVDDGRVRVQATQVAVSATTISVSLTWSSDEAVQLSCATTSAPGGSWWASSTSLPSAVTEQTSGSCPATGSLTIGANQPATDRHVFARDAAWGDGPATLAVWTVPDAATDPDRTTPATAELTVDLSQARFSAS